MFSTVCLALLASAQPNPLKPVIDAYDRLQSGSARVTVSVVGREKLSYSYDLYFKKGERFRIDWKDAKRNLIIIGDKSSILGYEPAGNRYVLRKVSNLDATYSYLYTLFDAAEPLVAAYLAPKNGFAQFLAFFGTARLKPSSTTNQYVSDQFPKLTLAVDPSTRLMRSLHVQGVKSLRADWRVKPAPIPLSQALKFQPPRGARKVVDLSAEPPAPIIVGVKAMETAHKAKQAFGNLSTIAFQSQSFIFPGTSERRKTVKVWWERDGNFRMELSADHPTARLDVLFDGRTLNVWDHAAKKQYTTDAKPSQIFARLRTVTNELDLLTTAILNDANFWDRIAVRGSKVKSVPDRALLAGKWCDVVEVSTPDGWTTRVYVAESNGWIMRIERRLMSDAKTVYSETVMLDYTVFGSAIGAASWKFEPPAGYAKSSFPKG